MAPRLFQCPAFSAAPFPASLRGSISRVSPRISSHAPHRFFSPCLTVSPVSGSVLGVSQCPGAAAMSQRCSDDVSVSPIRCVAPGVAPMSRRCHSDVPAPLLSLGSWRRWSPAALRCPVQVLFRSQPVRAPFVRARCRKHGRKHDRHQLSQIMLLHFIARIA